ncbi:hypothetical protein MEO42_02175 [Dolichospermum sp. ST_sed6]|nr:hypothetical protein [Dolichospermum sp. ST_sed6]
MNTVLNPLLTQTYNKLSTFAGSDNFWNLFDTTFGTQYNRSTAEILRLQWLSGDFSQLPQIEILDNSTLANANGAYAGSTNKIYLSANFIATSTPEAISAVLLEEIGHFVDAQINQTDTLGDEGEKFSALVRGQNLTTQELTRINIENDWANITVDGNQLSVEQAAPIVLTVTTTADQNDGSATGGLSLRDAILIANANTTNDYIINLTGGQTYSLSIKNTAALNDGGDEQAAVRGDLDILAGGKITIKSVGTQKAIIDATNLKTSFASGFGDSAIDVKDNAYLILNGVTITGASVGAVWIGTNSTAEISNSLITNNEITVASAGSESNQDGSGIANYGTLLLKDSTISNNKAARDGGGIFNAGTSTITNTTISGNIANRHGGGIYNGDEYYQNNVVLSITNTTVSGNSANGIGGGIFNREIAYLNNSTITNNTADLDSNSGSTGGEIYYFKSYNGSTTGTVNIDSNSDSTGGGIYNLNIDSSIFSVPYFPGTIYAKNTIIAGNFGTPNNSNGDIYGPINGNNYNLIGNTTGSSGTIGTGTDLVNSNILLGTLQNNGSKNQTHALLDGSLAINAGNNSLISLDTNDIDGDGNTTETIPFDQRGTGFSRIANNRVDIGAFEFQGIPSPFITINNISIIEGNSGTKTGTVTVNLNAASLQTVTVNYTTANNTAISGIDYTTTSGQLSFAPGETTKTINVNILGDNIAEANKSFFVNLSNPTNSFLYQTNVQGIVTITDDEPHPIILGSNSIPNPAITLTVNTTTDQNDGSATNGLSLRDAILIANADTTNDYIINLTGGTTYKLTAFSLTDTKGGDLDVLGNVTIQSTGTEPATIDASGLTNPDRVFQVSNYLNLGNIVVTGGSTSGAGGGIHIGQNATASLFNTTVKNNSSSSTGGGIFNSGLMVLLNSTVADNKSVNSLGGIYNSGQAILLGTTIKNNRAKSGGGVSNDGTLTISNSTIYNNTAEYFGGGIYQNAGTLSLINSTISENYGYYSGGIGAEDGVVNIFNSTITKNIATSNYQSPAGGIVNNGNRASLNLKNTIVAGNIGANPNILGSININNNNLIGGDAKLGPLQDNGNGIFTHALLSGSPAINAGNNDLIATDIFDIDIDGNDTETIPFDNRGSGYTRISGGTVDIGAFEFQPVPNLSLSINDVTLTEGNSGTKNATFTVTLSGETFQPVTVNYATANGTATAGSDYTATTGTLIFNVNPGETSKKITVPILGDTLVEGNETFFVNLSNPINANIADTQGIATITNDDFPVINLSANQSIVEGFTSPQNLSYTVTLSSASTQTITVQYATANGTATAASDYTSTSGTLTFNPGVTSQVINIPILNNSINEANETFTLTLSSPTNANLGTTKTVTTTITDTLTAAVTTTLPANGENLTLTGTIAINGTGNAGNNVIIGNAANNILNGALGIDTLIGGTGNDIYRVDTTTDMITENVGGGTDTIQSSVTFSLATLPNIENLTLTGTAAINGTGNAGNNLIIGNAANNSLDDSAGNDILNGGLGLDTLIGGIGNDIYVVDTTTDIITENANEGRDTIQSSVTFSLATLPNIENLTLTGTAAINGTGNAGNNVLTGNAANNILSGGLGNDILNGGLGIDTLIGGIGIDRFDYRNLANSVFNSVDVITDFNANASNDLFLVTTARSVFSNAGNVTTFDITGMTTNLTTVNFGANAAAQFTFGRRTFVAINDATAGFSGTTDAIVEVTGLIGTLGIGNFTTTLV